MTFPKQTKFAFPFYGAARPNHNKNIQREEKALRWKGTAQASVCSILHKLNWIMFWEKATKVRGNLMKKFIEDIWEEYPLKWEQKGIFK